MILARILIEYEDIVICDLAETYGIYDYKKLPMNVIASLILGLREESRLQQKLQNSKTSLGNYLLAGILDRLSILVWTKTKDGQKGANKPKMIIDTLVENKNSENKTFNSGEDFEREKERILKGGGK